MEGKGILTTFALVIIKQINIMGRNLDFDNVNNEYQGGFEFDGSDRFGSDNRCDLAVFQLRRNGNGIFAD